MSRLTRIALVREKVEAEAIPIEHLGHGGCLTAEFGSAYSRLGNEATEKLHALLNSGAVTMTSIDRDRDVYGRLLRNVAVGGGKSARR